MTGTRPRLTAAAFVAALIALALVLPAIASAAPEFALTTEINGSGEGAVGCKANGGPLEECEAEYPEGTELGLVAEPELGSEFVAWGGECDSIVGEECEVEMDSEKTVEVVFDLEELELTVETEGSGEGVVECQVEGGPYELCPGSETYPYGTAVTLFAEPEEGSEFVEWSGDCSGVEAECELAIEEPLGVTATFVPEPPFALTIETGGTGTGEVECAVEGGEPEECEAEYEEGTAVTLIAEADSGSEFIAWNGECDSVSDNECEVEMTADKTVEAVFDLEPLPEFALEVDTDGTGTGTVTSLPVGINCGSECEAEFEEGVEVTLTATPASGSVFAGWSGAGCSVTGTCIVTMSEAKEVTATFNLISRTLTITDAGTGTGEVKCKFNGGSAGACTSPQPNGTTVEIIATADAGSEFAGFSSGTGSASACSSSPCGFTITANSSVTATFDEEPTPEYDLTITKAGTGSGTVTCDGGACAPSYEEGEELTLAASAASGSTFTGWSGGGCSGTASCEVTIDADTTVTATFTANPAPPNPTPTPTPTPAPTPTPEGKAKAAATAAFKGGKAQLKLTCTGGPCKGTVKLTAKVKQGGKTKNLRIGKASFSIGEGATATVKVKLSGPAKQALAQGKTLKAKTSGTGIAGSTVKVKPAKK